MSTALFRTSAAARSALRAGSSKRCFSMASSTIVRGKISLPDLPYAYDALEPTISGQIMEYHHRNHHASYVNSYNNTCDQLANAHARGDLAAAITLQPLVNFHGGAHLNHCLFWENLAPTKKGGGGEPTGPLKVAIQNKWGDFPAFKARFSEALAGIQGSGWVWLVKDMETRQLEIRVYANQDAVVGKYSPLLGIDGWEHAYYLQYQYRKGDYFNAIWDVINWRMVYDRW